jgi:AAA15 family ATPase/GTPase
MITRFYVDNYKCLQNFEYKPAQLELIVGANGTGKTTVFEALDKVRRFVTGQADAKELFPSECKTRWSSRLSQLLSWVTMLQMDSTSTDLKPTF